MTTIERAVLDAIRDYRDANGVSPSIAEVAAVIDRSRARVQQLVERLVAAGRLRRLPGRMRSLVPARPSRRRGGAS